VFICVVDGLDNVERDSLNKRLSNVRFFSGDPSSGLVLSRMNVAESMYVVLLPSASVRAEQELGQTNHSKVLFTLIALESLIPPHAATRIMVDSATGSGSMGILNRPVQRSRIRLGNPCLDEVISFESGTRSGDNKSSVRHEQQLLNAVRRRRTVPFDRGYGELAEGAHSLATPMYASGEVVMSSVPSAVLGAELFSPGIIWLLYTLAGASRSRNHLKLHLWNVPDAWDGKTYGELAAHLLGTGEAIPLGLFRSGAAPVYLHQLRASSPRWYRRDVDNHLNEILDRAFQANEVEQQWAPPPSAELVENALGVLPWVYTNPELHTILSKFDAVYVHCIKSKFLAEMHLPA